MKGTYNDSVSSDNRFIRRPFQGSVRSYDPTKRAARKRSPTFGRTNVRPATGFMSQLFDVLIGDIDSGATGELVKYEAAIKKSKSAESSSRGVTRPANADASEKDGGGDLVSTSSNTFNEKS
jgi:hypothetical protein